MNLTELKQSLSESKPPDGISEYVRALWYDANNDWDKSHKLIQDINNATASWIHAYLHRKEGDVFNADYWYSKAGKTKPSVSINEEWEQIAAALL